MKIQRLAILTLTMVLLASCTGGSKTESLIGKWQPSGDDGRLLEFTPEGYYNLFVGDMNIFQDIEDYGRIKYQFEEAEDKIMLNLMDENLTKEFVKGEIKIIDEDHISIAFYQNSGDINVQEEYIRVKE